MKIIQRISFIAFILTVIFLSQELSAQIGGTHIYGYLSQSPSARQTALGNGAIAYAFPTSSVMFANPALLTSERHNYSASAQHQFQLSGIGNGSVSYAQSLIDSTWTFGLGIQYTDYGEFQEYDEYEIHRGEFSALDAAVQLTASKQIGPRLHIGTSLKVLSSSYELYNSIGIGVDIGALYYIPEQHLGLSFVMSNLAFQLSSYNVEEKGMPADFQVGVSKRLEHVPLRFHITYHHLNKWKLLDDPDNSSTDNDFFKTEKSKLDVLANDFLSHIVIGTEVGIGQHRPVYLRVSYNHMLGQALSVGYYRGFTGIALGLGINVKGLRFDYGYSIAHLAGGKHAIGLAYAFEQKPKKTALRQ